MPEISFITTCKGRLDHLRQTLPLMVAQEGDCQVVVVDYSCPDGTAAWVAGHFPQVTVVEAKGETGFHKARALNLGARAARAPWLMFIDADVLLAPGFLGEVRSLLASGSFFRPTPLTTDTWGSCIVSRSDFLAIGGYDEVLRDWGSEDDDLYFRLATFANCNSATFPGSLLSALTHDDAARTRFFAEDDRWLSQRANVLYLHVKYDLVLLAGVRRPEQAMLQSIYGEARRAVKQAAIRGESRVRLTVKLGPIARVPMQAQVLRRQIDYDLELLSGQSRIAE